MKKLRSQPPDVIVSVGSGEAKVEFECYKVILSYGCPYFDSMLSLPLRESETSRIEFPDKDPKEWEIFYEFLDPATIATAEVTTENAMILAPWFQEYQMQDRHRQCDEIISKSEVFCAYVEVPEADTLLRWCIKDIDPEHRTVETIKKLFEYYFFCEQHSLSNSRLFAVGHVGIIMQNCCDLFLQDLGLLKVVIEIFHNEREVLKMLFLDKDMYVFEFYSEIADEADNCWNSKQYDLWIKSKLENMCMKIHLRRITSETNLMNGEEMKAKIKQILNKVEVAQSS